MAIIKDAEFEVNVNFAIKFAKWCDYHGWRKHYAGLEYKETPYWFGGFSEQFEDKAITDEKIIHTVLYNINQYWEKNLYWDNATAFSNNWKNVIDEKYLIPHESAGLWEEEIKELKGNYIIIPQAMIKSLKITFGDDIKVIGDNAISNSKGDKKIIENIDKRQAYLLEEAVSFLEDANFKIKYPIKIVKFNNPSVFGQADDDVIYLSEKLFNMGKRKIAAVIIEENEHNSTGYGDESREFQTHFIDLYLGALEDKLSRYL
jgi:hypothetical protein